MVRSLIIILLLLIPIAGYSAEVHGFVEIGRENFHERFYTDMEIRLEFDIYSLKNTIYGGNQILATMISFFLIISDLPKTIRTHLISQR